MKLTFKGTNYDITGEILAFAEKKISALQKLAGDESMSEMRVDVELGRETEAHQNGRVWRAELNVDKAGDRFRATATEESLEDAIDRVIGDMARELRSAKNKKQGLMKRGGAAVKSMLRGLGQ